VQPAYGNLQRHHSVTQLRQPDLKHRLPRNDHFQTAISQQTHEPAFQRHLIADLEFRPLLQYRDARAQVHIL
jgi:hypothetical protein